MTASTTNHTETPMTKTNMDLSELLAKQDGGDFLRSVAEAVLQLIMEADVEGLIGAGKHERSNDRATWRRRPLNHCRMQANLRSVLNSPCNSSQDLGIFTKMEAMRSVRQCSDWHFLIR